MVSYTSNSCTSQEKETFGMLGALDIPLDELAKLSSNDKEFAGSHVSRIVCNDIFLTQLLFSSENT